MSSQNLKSPKLKFETVDLFVDKNLNSFFELQFGPNFFPVYKSDVLKFLKEIQQQTPSFISIADIHFDRILRALDDIFQSHLELHYTDELFNEKVRIVNLRFARHIYLPDDESLIVVFYYVFDQLFSTESSISSFRLENLSSKTYRLAS